MRVGRAIQAKRMLFPLRKVPRQRICRAQAVRLRGQQRRDQDPPAHVLDGEGKAVHH